MRELRDHHTRGCVLINADDLGIQDDVNETIVESLQAHHCCRASIMANMGGFEAACELVHKNGLADRIGVHWVLTEGCPLTDKIKRCGRFCNVDGRFVLRRDKRLLRLDSMEREALAVELAAQVARCRASGLPTLHADSHHHVHEEWGLTESFMKVCKTERIKSLRLARNIGLRSGVLREAYRRVLNHRVRKAGLAEVEFFGSAGDYIYAVQNGQIRTRSGTTEVMVHPIPGSAGVPMDGDTRMDELVQKITSLAFRNH